MPNSLSARTERKRRKGRAREDFSYLAMRESKCLMTIERSSSLSWPVLVPCSESENGEEEITSYRENGYIDIIFSSW